MGIGTLGFLSGASKVALDSIQQRQKDEADIKKTRMLEELRAATAKDLADYEDLLKGKHVNEKLSRFEDGEFVMYNDKGEKLGSRAATAAELEEQEFAKRKDTLSLDALSADIDQSRASAQASRASAGYSRAAAANVGKPRGGSLDGSSSTKAPISAFDIAKELRYQQADRVEALIKSGVPKSAVVELSESVAANAVNAKLSFAEAQSQFKAAAAMLAGGVDDSADPSAYSLDSFKKKNPSAARRLQTR